MANPESISMRLRIGRCIVVAFCSVVVAAIAGSIATEAFLDQRRREVESDPRYQYNSPNRTIADTSLGGCLGSLAGTLVGGSLLWITRGHLWILIIPAGMGLAAVVGYAAGHTLPVPFISMPRKEPFAFGGIVGGCLGAFISLVVLMKARLWHSRGPSRTNAR